MHGKAPFGLGQIFDDLSGGSVRQVAEHLFVAGIGWRGQQHYDLPREEDLEPICRNIRRQPTVLGQAIQEPIKAAFALGVALVISWKLVLFIVIFAPLMAFVIKKFGKKMRRASRAALQRSSLMLGQIEGTLIGIRVVKSAGAERFEREVGVLSGFGQTIELVR